MDSSCKNVLYDIPDHKFTSELRLFPLSNSDPLGNSDVILGVDWLRQHNPITFDYQKVWVKFQREGKWITLQGDTKEGSLHTITGKKISKLFKAFKGMI